LLAAQDTVYVADGLTLMALNASDGKERWHVATHLGNLLSGSLLAVGNGIALSQSGTTVSPTLSALRTVDGKLLWSLPMNYPVDSARIVGDVVYTTVEGQPTASLYALGVRDGKVRWQFQQAGLVLAQAFAQDAVYVTVEALDGSADTLFALNPSDGRERWHLSFSNGDYFALGPTEVNGVVYVALDAHDRSNGCTQIYRTDPPGTLYALSTRDGKPVWHSLPPQAGKVFEVPAVDQNVIIYSADEQNAYAFNAADGLQLWRSQIPQSSDAAFAMIEAPIIGGRFVYLTVIPCGFNRQPAISLWALNKSDGHAAWHYQEPVNEVNDMTYPLVLNGIVYVTSPTGSVAALNGSDGTQIWQSTSPLTNLTSNAA
jgi:outer membrane protein assembly factor BamB